jgi:hypothetical protein
MEVLRTACECHPRESQKASICRQSLGQVLKGLREDLKGARQGERKMED